MFPYSSLSHSGVSALRKIADPKNSVRNTNAYRKWTTNEYRDVPRRKERSIMPWVCIIFNRPLLRSLQNKRSKVNAVLDGESPVNK